MCLANKYKDKLISQERKIIRRIIGPKNENNQRKALMNYEIRSLMG